MTIAEQKRMLEKALDSEKAVRGVGIRMGFPSRLVVMLEPGADRKAVWAAISKLRTENPVDVEIDGPRSAYAL
jgi:hypothetical protein